MPGIFSASFLELEVGYPFRLIIFLEFIPHPTFLLYNRVDIKITESLSHTSRKSNITIGTHLEKVLLKLRFRFSTTLSTDGRR